MGLKNPIGVDVVDKEQKIVLANYGNDEIIVMDLNGKLIWRKKFDNLHRHYGLEVRNGFIYATFNKENIVAKISLKSGKLIYSIGSLLSDGTKLNNIQGISVGPKGNIYAIDTINKRIIVFGESLKEIAILFNKEFDIICGLDVSQKTGEIMVSGLPINKKTLSLNTGAWIFKPIFKYLN